MKYYLRVIDWLLLGMGSVLGVLGLLASFGLVQIQIGFFGIDLETSLARTTWVVAWLAAAAAGLALLYLTRRGTQHPA